MRIIVESPFAHVCHIHRLFCSDQAQRTQQYELFFIKIQRAHRPGFVQHGLTLLQHWNQARCFFVSTGLRCLDEFGKMAFDSGKIRQREFGIDGLDIGQRIHLPRHVDNVFIFEAAYDMGNRIGLANVGEELVAEAFALGGTRHQSCDINEFDDRRHHLLRFDDGRQRRKARIRHLDDANIGLNGAEGIVFRCDASLGQGIEQGGFADVG